MFKLSHSSVIRIFAGFYQLFSSYLINHIEVSQNGRTPKSPMLNRIFHYKPVQYYKPSGYWGAPMTMETPTEFCHFCGETEGLTLVISP
jgi:hypothetical protein